MDLKETTCYDPTEDFDEGVELSVHLLSQPHEWIPVTFIYYIHNNNSHPGTSLVGLGEQNDENFRIRGYPVTPLLLGSGKGQQTIQICDLNTSDSIQFRWLQSSVLSPSVVRDTWIIDNITVVLHQKFNANATTLLIETFDNTALK